MSRKVNLTKNELKTIKFEGENVQRKRRLIVDFQT